MKIFNAILLLFLIVSCNTEKKYPEIGEIVKLDSSLDSIISSGEKPEIIAEGFEWSEGPLWIEDQQMLLFSDVPANTIYQWTEKEGKKIYLTPSGYTDQKKRGGETGSNGLTLDPEGRLVLCQHGDRRLAFMNAPIANPEASFKTIADNYQGKKLNSPNDAVYNQKGEVYFTDPPYGLEKNMEDSLKETPFQGVYMVKKNGEVVLVLDSITRPNGISFLPGENKLIIANSDPAKPNWYLYNVQEDGSLQNGSIFYSASGFDKNTKGLPDGMKTDKQGNVFATGPGGVWIFNSAGKLAGKILVPEATSNCALSKDEKTLFITNDMYVLRMKLRK